MLALYIALGICAVLLIAAAVIYFMGFYIKPKRKRKPLTLTTELEARFQEEPDIERSHALASEILDLPFERVEITSRDGLCLAGRYYAFEENAGRDAPLVLMFHGYRGSPTLDLRGIFQTVRSLGCDILCVSERAHGESEGCTTTLGVKERLDCLDWARFADKMTGGRRALALFGDSMGAATVLMASELELPASVRCIVADCGYTSPREIVLYVTRKLRLGFLFPLVVLGARLFGGFSLEKRGAVDAVQNTRLPILFFHGEKDRIVPCEMGRRLFAAATGEKRLVTFENAQHVQSCLLNEEEYRAALSELFEAHLFYGA